MRIQDDSTKENPMLEIICERRLRETNAKKGVDALSEGGGKVRIRRIQDAVS